tara:strand:- start:312 stop:602 length:291 start_codon:yes stop_codon:yes gene_type:complete
MNSVLVGLLARNLYKVNTRSYSAFLKVPYKEQYESRDNENEKIKGNFNSSRRDQYKLKEFIDNYNPYLSKEDISNVSDNLDNHLKEFYKYKYQINH